MKALAFIIVYIQYIFYFYNFQNIYFYLHIFALIALRCTFVLCCYFHLLVTIRLFCCYCVFNC